MTESMQSVLVIGLGEVGRPIYEIIKESGKFDVYGYDIDPNKSVDDLELIPSSLDYLHIAVPYTNDFVDIVVQYINKLNPDIVIIHSTVAPKTTRKIYKSSGIITAYSPVRGIHRSMKRHLMFWSKWVTALPKEKLNIVSNHLSSIGFKVKTVNASPETLELAKLWETVYRAIMIAAWQELHRIAKTFNVDVELLAEFIGEIHGVLRDRPVYYPSYIGGHCLIPNTNILKEVYPSSLLNFIINSNNLRADEIKDPEIAREVEALKTIALKYANQDYFKESLDHNP